MKKEKKSKTKKVEKENHSPIRTTFQVDNRSNQLSLSIFAFQYHSLSVPAMKFIIVCIFFLLNLEYCGQEKN